MIRTDVFAIASRPSLRCAAHGAAIAACAMQRRAHRAVAACALAFVFAPSFPGPASGATGPSLEWAVVPPVFGPAVAVPPLDTLAVTGGYGEVRSNHFHAGWDFSTGGRVGRPVRAPLAGWVERVRSSGVGYGRSLYLRADDGRLLVFGHLDAFAPALAALVDSAKRAAALYEQDLWPARGRFRFAAGDTLAWTGESGAGAPHLHVEIRHDDFAIHPLRGGLVPGRVGPPRLAWLTLEPLDERSRVAGGLMPRTIAPRGADTLEAEGRLRAVVRSVSGVPGAGDSPAWSTALEWNGETVEARLDSISWAGEMSEIDLLVDRGRIAGREGLVLWAPPGFRPRFLRASAPESAAAGVIEVRRGDPPRALRLLAREPGGAPVERTVVLRPPAGPGPAGTRRRPPARPTAKPAAAREPAWAYAVLPGPRVRVRVSGAPADVREASIGRAGEAGVRADWDGAAWVAILDGGPLPDASGLRVSGRRDGGGEWTADAGEAMWPAGAGAITPAPGMTLALSPGDVFEPGIAFTRVRPGAGARAQGLAAVGARVRMRPETLPLRRALRVTLPVASGDAARLGVYRRRGAGAWEWMGARHDAAARSLSAESSLPGEFAVLRDTLAPFVRALAPPRAAAKGPYSRWQLVASVVERGSGLDAGESAFFVDGARVPTEWDPEERELRWRPLAPPESGSHRYEVRAVDRAGNVASRRGSFVLDSARR